MMKKERSNVSRIRNKNILNLKGSSNKKLSGFQASLFFISLIFIFLLLGYALILSIDKISNIYNNLPQSREDFFSLSSIKWGSDDSQTKDVYIYENNPNLNFKDINPVYIGNFNSYKFNSLFYFDISSIPPQQYILSAKFNFSVSSLNPGCSVNISELNSYWDEEYTTWMSKDAGLPWSNPGGDYDNSYKSIDIFSTGIYSVDITDMVKSWYLNPSENSGIILYPKSNVECLIGIYSIEDSNILARPKISIEYTSSAPPVFESVSSDSDNLGDMKNVGENITFEALWTDYDNQRVSLFVCNSSNINIYGCSGKTYCSSTNQENPASCRYDPSDLDNRTSKFYVGICDSESCDVSEENLFYVNHPSYAHVLSPNGGETITSGTNSYAIRFNVSDKDKDIMRASIYLGTLEDMDKYTILDNVLLNSLFCTDNDGDRSTLNNCSYDWNPSQYWIENAYITLVLNDSYSKSNDSSDSFFRLYALEDPFPPIISSYSLSPTFYSGEDVNVNVSVHDLESSIKKVWISINTTPVSIVDLELYQGDYNDGNFSGLFSGFAPGNYEATIYAQDQRDNVENTSRIYLEVLKPEVSISIPASSSLILPYNVLRVSGNLSSETSLKGISAFLNVPEGFVFLEESPQYQYLGDVESSESLSVNWFLSSPINEGEYVLNITYYDAYTNNWTSDINSVLVTSSVGGGYFLDISGYPSVVKGDEYYLEAFFKSSEGKIDVDSITAIFYDSIGNKYEPIVMDRIDVGRYNLSFLTSSEGISLVIINATKGGISYYNQQFFNVLGGLHDLGDIIIKSRIKDNILISVSTINKGNAATDFNLDWILTKYPSGGMIKEGSLNTFAVLPGETIIKEIYTSSDYVGQAKILFIGSYPQPNFENKAYAWDIFTIEPSGGTIPDGGGGSGGGGGGSSGTTSNNSIVNEDINIGKENDSDNRESFSEDKTESETPEKEDKKEFNYWILIVILLSIMILGILILVFFVYNLYRKQNLLKFLENEVGINKDNISKGDVAKRIDEIEKKIKD